MVDYEDQTGCHYLTGYHKQSVQQAVYTDKNNLDTTSTLRLLL